MSNRFSGWTMSAVNKLMSGSPREDDIKVISISKKKIKAPSPDYVGMISSALKILGVEHVREYKFLHDRRFKFDIAIPGQKIAVEFEGGIFSSGRHTRGKGYANDAKKYNLAAMHGWKLLRYTSADVQKLNWEFSAAEEIRKLIKTSEDL